MVFFFKVMLWVAVISNTWPIYSDSRPHTIVNTNLRHKRSFPETECPKGTFRPLPGGPCINETYGQQLHDKKLIHTVTSSTYSLNVLPPMRKVTTTNDATTTSQLKPMKEFGHTTNTPATEETPVLKDKHADIATTETVPQDVLQTNQSQNTNYIFNSTTVDNKTITKPGDTFEEWKIGLISASVMIFGAILVWWYFSCVVRQRGKITSVLCRRHTYYRQAITQSTTTA